MINQNYRRFLPGIIILLIFFSFFIGLQTGKEKFTETLMVKENFTKTTTMIVPTTITSTKTITNMEKETLTSTSTTTLTDTKTEKITSTTTITDTNYITETLNNNITLTHTITKTETQYKNYFYNYSLVINDTLPPSGLSSYSRSDAIGLYNYGEATMVWNANGTVFFNITITDKNNHTVYYTFGPSTSGEGLFPIMPTKSNGFIIFQRNTEDYPVNVTVNITFYAIMPNIQK